jgi:hypothetical protein
VSGWDCENTTVADNSTRPSKTKSREPKCSTVVRTGCSSGWAPKTLASVVIHEVPLPGAPTVKV